MKKLIIKTTVITVLILVAVITLTIFLFSAFAPKTVADFALSIGNKPLAVKYSEKYYQKTNDINDLSTLLERCIWAEDNEKIIIYSEQLTALENYQEFLSGKDGGFNYYVFSNYVLSLYRLNKKDKAVEVAFYNTSSYVPSSPMHALAIEAINKNDKQTLENLSLKLETLSSEGAKELFNQINLHLK